MQKRFLLDKNRRQNAVMPSATYDLLYHFILKVLAVFGYVRFNELLDLASRDNAFVGYHNLGLSLMLVKRDMEARDVIEVKVTSATLVQTIRLKRQRKTATAHLNSDKIPQTIFTTQFQSSKKALL